MTKTSAILVYLLAINVVTLVVCGIDKYEAKHAKWRISEATLLLLAVIGGGIGAWCGMKAWYHKTMHKKFKYGVPLMFILQLTVAMWIVNRFAVRANPVYSLRSSVSTVFLMARLMFCQAYFAFSLTTSSVKAASLSFVK